MPTTNCEPEPPRCPPQRAHTHLSHSSLLKSSNPMIMGNDEYLVRPAHATRVRVWTMSTGCWWWTRPRKFMKVPRMKPYCKANFDLLQFQDHQKIFSKTCMCAVKVALNFQLIRKSGDTGFSDWCLCTSILGLRSWWVSGGRSISRRDELLPGCGCSHDTVSALRAR